MIANSTFAFLTDLKANNHKDWFTDNRKRYDEAKSDFEGFVTDLIKEISKFDDNIGHHKAKDCIFRINRDVRFAKDKSPYKTNFGAHITSATSRSEIHSRAGYYLHLEPGRTMLAGGAYLPEAPWLKAIRQEIDYNGAAFKSILNAKDFKAYFGELEGEKLKNAPKEFPKDHPDIELLKYKSFLATHKPADELVLSKDFLKHCGKVFKVLHPFDRFLNDAVK